MSTESPPTAFGRTVEELHALRDKWGWFLVLGIALVILGMMAIGSANIAALAVATTFGFLLMASGIIEIVSAFWARKWSGFFLHILTGVLYLIVGEIMTENPAAVAAFFTLMLAAFFLVGGLVRIIVALTHRFQNWVWMLASGVVTLLLGIMIWRQWPESSYWVIGTFVGIELLFTGWSWVMLALMVRNLPKPVA